MASGTVTQMGRRPVDDLIDRAQRALEDLRASVHEQIEAAEEHQAATEQLTDEIHKRREDR